jgi:hypothetical protein
MGEQARKPESGAVIRWLIKQLLAAVVEVFNDWRIERDYQEALKENARRDAEARDLAGQVATRERMQHVSEMASDDDGSLRDWLRSRDPRTK